MNNTTNQKASQEGVFDKRVAMLLDANCAIIYHQLRSWIEYNEVKRQNFYDGRYWTFNSVREWCELLPYFSEKQIWGALERLEKAGLVVTGNYNKQAYDRTKWYSVNPPPQGEMHFTSRENGFDQEGEPIPIINTDIKPPLLEEHEKISENQNEIGKVFKAYQSNIGILTPMVATNIQEALEVDNIPPDWIVAAIGEAVSNEKRNWAYVRAILMNWKANGFQSNKSKPQGKAKGGFKKPKYDMGDYEVSHKSEIHIVEDKDWEGFDGEVPF